MGIRVNNVEDLNPALRKKLEEMGHLDTGAPPIGMYGGKAAASAPPAREMLLLYEGVKQWDYYLDISTQQVYAIAKPDTGCKDHCFGSLTLFNKIREQYEL